VFVRNLASPQSAGVAQSKLRDPEANCEASAVTCAATICTKSDINARFVIRISETATDRPFLCPGIGLRATVYTLVCRTRLKKTPVGAKREIRWKESIVRVLFFPTIDRTNISRYLQCTYCSSPPSPPSSIPPLFFTVPPFPSFSSSSWTHSPAICLLCRLCLTATETPSYHAIHFHVYSTRSVRYLSIQGVYEPPLFCEFFSTQNR